MTVGDGVPMLRVSVEDARELRQALVAMRDLAFEAVPVAEYRCRLCGGRGPWPTEVAHGSMPGDGPDARLCRVARGLDRLAHLVAWINANETRAIDSPAIGGEEGGGVRGAEGSGDPLQFLDGQLGRRGGARVLLDPDV